MIAVFIGKCTAELKPVCVNARPEALVSPTSLGWQDVGDEAGGHDVKRTQKQLSYGL